jgi:hypothetical protein
LTREFRRLALQAIDVHVINKEPPISVLTNILHDYLESTDDEAPDGHVLTSALDTLVKDL